MSARKKNDPRSRHAQKVRMLKAAVRRAEKRGDSFGAVWARGQLEIQTGEIMPAKTDAEGGVYGK